MGKNFLSIGGEYILNQDIFKIIVPEKQLHIKFKMIVESTVFKSQREILQKWSDNYYDKDGKFINEFQTTYDSSVWELYLSEVFRDLGFKVEEGYNRPDFVITEPVKMNVEAVTSKIKNTGRKENTRNMSDALEMFECVFKSDNFQSVLDEAITRHSNAICMKHKKIVNEYSKCDWVDSNDPFVLALGSYDQIRYGREFIFPLVALLYGDYLDMRIGDFVKKTEILKPGTEANIPIGIFSNEKYSDISAILYSCSMTIGKLTSLALSKEGTTERNNVINVRYDNETFDYKFQIVSHENPEHLADGIFIFHNPNAKNPLSIDVFRHSNITQVTSNIEDKFRLLTCEMPLVARVDFPTIGGYMTLENVLQVMNFEYNIKKIENSFP